MAESDGAGTDRTAVKVYVPAYQKEIWEDHAERLEMTQSEFVRTMVQAGRRGFDLGDADDGGTDDLAGRVLDVLEEDDHTTWEELVAALTDDFEDRLEETLSALQDDNRVRYSGREGGYTLVEP